MKMMQNVNNRRDFVTFIPNILASAVNIHSVETCIEFPQKLQFNTGMQVIVC